MSPRSWTYLAILLGLVFHGALMPFTYGQTYDAYIHMFFGNHYLESWFDPWETRWYTGFTVTAYPPGSHQALGLLMRHMDMRIAFILLQLLAVILLITGVYRFSRLWVNDKAASYAAILCVFSTSISETLHIFGQLPTLLSIALFLNAIPHISSWIEHGKKSDFFLGICLTAATTAVHHVTPLFGTVFFIAPVGLAAWLSNLKSRRDIQPSNRLAMIKWASPALIRGIFVGLSMLLLIIVIVFPYWHWSVTDPITQISIPHGSRENFIVKPNLGLMFFVIPWGLLLFIVPYAIKKSLNSALWPLGLSVLVALFLGTGGTTPFPKILLGPAFEILTLDRFTFWATILILPFAGLAVQSMWEGKGKVLLRHAFGAFVSRAGLVLILVCYVGLAVGTALLPIFRPTQPDFINPAPIVKFMDEDRHSDWRYLTLGFGDQFAYHSALINAESVDGNYHSARRLPSLMNYSVERLENSKYAGVPGLASLNQFLTNAEKFHLKYVFSNDEFYDPVLHYTGWNPVTRLNNGINVWEKPDISPLPDIRPKRELPHYQKLMWGTLPITALALGLLTLIALALTQKLISGTSHSFSDENSNTIPVIPSRKIIGVTRMIPCLVGFICLGITSLMVAAHQNPISAEKTVEKFYQHLDFRETHSAFNLITPNPNMDYGQFLRIQKLTGGLVPSYGKLTDITHTSIDTRGDNKMKVDSDLTYLTSVGIRIVSSELMLSLNTEGKWKINYNPPAKSFTPNLIHTQIAPQFRDLTAQRILEVNDPIQRLARPKIELMAAEFIERDGRMYIAGRIKNISQFPTCTKIMAKTHSLDSDISLDQHSGRVGAHRLLPGEDSAFRIDFEGYLKIKDQDFNAPYDPDQFSVTELEALPDTLSLNLSSTVCSPNYYKSIHLSDLHTHIDETGRTLSMNITNQGTEIVSTLQIKLSYLDATGNLTWVAPFYLQNNLIPGEERQIQIPLVAITGPANIPKEKILINGKSGSIATNSLWPLGMTLPDGSGEVIIDFDAMTYRPLD